MILLFFWCFRQLTGFIVSEWLSTRSNNFAQNPPSWRKQQFEKCSFMNLWRFTLTRCYLTRSQLSHMLRFGWSFQSFFTRVFGFLDGLFLGFFGFSVFHQSTLAFGQLKKLHEKTCFFLFRETRFYFHWESLSCRCEYAPKLSEVKFHQKINMGAWTRSTDLTIQFTNGGQSTW